MKPININIKSPGSISVLVVIALIVFFSVYQCNQANRSNGEAQVKLHNAQKEVIDANEREKAAGVRVDSIKDEVLKRDTIIKDVYAERDVFKKHLDVTTDRVKELSAGVRVAKIIRDTVRYYEACDSLAQAANELTILNASYVEYTTELEGLYLDQLKAKDSIEGIKDRLYAGLKVSFDNLSRDYIKMLQDKPKNKRISIGPAVGYGIGKDFRPAPFAGIVISYSFIKF